MVSQTRTTILLMLVTLRPRNQCTVACERDRHQVGPGCSWRLAALGSEPRLLPAPGRSSAEQVVRLPPQRAAEPLGRPSGIQGGPQHVGASPRSPTPGRQSVRPAAVPPRPISPPRNGQQVRLRGQRPLAKGRAGASSRGERQRRGVGRHGGGGELLPTWRQVAQGRKQGPPLRRASWSRCGPGHFVAG